MGRRLAPRALAFSSVCALTVAILAAAPRDAAAGPLLEKALAYSQNFQDVHSPAYGCSVEVQFASPTSSTVVAYHDEGDSSIWTGNYVAAESYRYAVTHDPEAKAFGLRAVNCLLALEEVTGKPGFVARWIGPAEPPFYFGGCEGDCHLVTDGPYAGTFWLGNTSSDQYLGWWYGLSHAYEYLLDSMDDEPTRQRIRGAMSRVVDTLLADDYLIIDPDGTVSTAGPNQRGHKMMAYIDVTARAVGEPYTSMAAQIYSENLFDYLFLTAYPITRWFQYYAFHLGHMAQHMVTKWELNPFWDGVNKQILHDRLYVAVQDTQQVMFDYIAFGMGGATPTPELLDGDRAALAAFPDPPKRRINPAQGPFEWDPFPAAMNDLVDFVESIIPGLGLPHFNEQALEPFPLDERCVTGFRWQTPPYEVCGGSDPAFEYPGMDYLVAYWLGRYHGFVSESD
ncbi:MAG: hypothetical protein IPK07_14830 [Deltaproteobacteria bacterium]|nr:hypothetical protein [Deltaproteobacteria bacterium]